MFEIYDNEFLVFQFSMQMRIFDDDSLIEVILSVQSKNDGGYFSQFQFKKLNMALIFFYAYLSQASLQYLL